MAPGHGAVMPSDLEYLKAAFLAMEPANCFITLARRFGGGSITTEVQSFILEHCINNASKEIARNHSYVYNILKKVILAAEKTCDVVVEGLYEQFAHHIAFQMEDDLLRDKSKIYKQVSFIFPSCYDNISSSSSKLVIPLQCSLNMLEGDTGCALWPSCLFLSELILSYPKVFSNKLCFEIGSGVGLAGISLVHVGASQVVLTDGNMSCLANMKCNLELNRFSSESKVECKYLPWESCTGSELNGYQPDIVLGADIIYDPLCIPHLVRVLSMLLKTTESGSTNPRASDRNGDAPTLCSGQHEVKETPTAYIAQVIRNRETFDYFVKQAEESHLSVVDVTEVQRPLNLLPYMLSYDRQSVRLYQVSPSWN